MSTEAAAPTLGLAVEGAWAVLTPYYMSHGPELRKHACQRLRAGSVPSRRASDLADDLVIDVFLMALETIKRGEHIENPPGWLHTAVGRKAGKIASRAESRIIPCEPQRLARPLWSEPDRSSPDPAEKVADNPDEELLKELKTGLQQLTDTQRIVLSLLFEYQLTPVEVANYLGVSASTVRVHKFKALNRLHMSLTSRGSLAITVVVGIAFAAAVLSGGVPPVQPALAVSSPLRTRSEKDRRRLIRTALQSEELQCRLQEDLRRAGLCQVDLRIVGHEKRAVLHQRRKRRLAAWRFWLDEAYAKPR